MIEPGTSLWSASTLPPMLLKNIFGHFLIFLNIDPRWTISVWRLCCCRNRCICVVTTVFGQILLNAIAGLHFNKKDINSPWTNHYRIINKSCNCRHDWSPNWLPDSSSLSIHLKYLISELLQNATANADVSSQFFKRPCLQILLRAYFHMIDDVTGRFWAPVRFYLGTFLFAR